MTADRYVGDSYPTVFVGGAATRQASPKSTIDVLSGVKSSQLRICRRTFLLRVALSPPRATEKTRPIKRIFYTVCVRAHSSLSSTSDRPRVDSDKLFSFRPGVTGKILFAGASVMHVRGDTISRRYVLSAVQYFLGDSHRPAKHPRLIYNTVIRNDNMEADFSKLFSRTNNHDRLSGTTDERVNFYCFYLGSNLLH